MVPAGDYDVTFTPVGGTARSLVGALPMVPAGLYPASWVNANGIPKQLAFGWVASTGAATDYHEIDNVVVTSLNPVPQLAVSQTSYAAATLTPGSPVTYTVAASSSGAAENLPVTVTETLPGGVLPVGASGPGWVCGAPSGQQISCTNSTSPFTSGTITVNGVVTSSSVTPALIQSSTTAVASSADANPATSSSAPAGTVPAAPVVTSVTPTNGPAGGDIDVTVTGTNLSGATAIEIGTAAEFTAGTPDHPEPVLGVGARLLHRHQRHQPRHLRHARPRGGIGHGQSRQPGHRRQPAPIPTIRARRCCSPRRRAVRSAWPTVTS